MEGLNGIQTTEQICRRYFDQTYILYGGDLVQDLDLGAFKRIIYWEIGS